MAKQDSEFGSLTASVGMGSDIVYDLYCGICNEDDIHLEAEGFCVDCQDYLCRDCFKGHRRTRISRNHVLQDKTHMPQQKPSQSMAISSTGTCTEKCIRHLDRLVEYYCRDDRTLGCSVCMTMHHRLCKSVDHIPDLAETLLDSQEYKQFNIKLHSLQTKSQNVIKRTKGNVTKVEKWFSDTVDMLHELRKKMNEAFDKFEGNLKNKVSTIKSADLKKMHGISDKGHAVFDEVRKISAELQSLRRKNQLAQLFTHMIKLEDKLKTLHKLLAVADTDNSVSAYTFETGYRVQEIIGEPTSIGTLSVQDTDRPMLSPSTTKPTVKKSYIQPSVAPSATPIAEGPKPMRAAEEREINVRKYRDKHAGWITGSELLPGNKLIITVYTNQKVKLLNLQTSEVTSELTTSSGPYDTTSISSDQIAVTLPFSKTILFVNVIATLKKGRAMSVAGDCRAILHNNGKLIVSFERPGKIEIMTLDGTVERSIYQPGVLTSPRHMALSLDCETIYAAGYEDVKRITLDGTVMAVYRDYNLNRPGGLTVDQHGRVLVCGTRSCNIHLLTPDLSKDMVLVDKVEYPESLSYCRNTDRLIIGMQTNNLKVYQLS